LFVLHHFKLCTHLGYLLLQVLLHPHEPLGSAQNLCAQLCLVQFDRAHCPFHLCTPFVHFCTPYLYFNAHLLHFSFDRGDFSAHLLHFRCDRCDFSTHFLHFRFDFSVQRRKTPFDPFLRCYYAMQLLQNVL